MAQLDRATVCGTVGRRFESSWARHISGEVAERSKAVDSKSAVPYGYRGFESHPLLSPHGEKRLAYPGRQALPLERNLEFGSSVTLARGGSPPSDEGGNWLIVNGER